MTFKTVDLSKSYQQSQKLFIRHSQLFAAFVQACVAAFCSSASPQEVHMMMGTPSHQHGSGLYHQAFVQTQHNKHARNTKREGDDTSRVQRL